MVDRRVGRKRSRVSEDGSDLKEDLSPSQSTASRGRVRPHREHALDVPPPVEESVMESGHAGDDSSDTPPRPQKRKRVEPIMTASTPHGVESTEPWGFFYNLVSELFDDENGEEFRIPVLKKYKSSEVPNYRGVVREPMDLGTIRSRLRNGHYVMRTPNSATYCLDEEKCLRDIRLVFENCMKYNEDGSAFYDIANEMLETIDTRLRSRELRREKAVERAKRDAERRHRHHQKIRDKAAATKARQAAAAAAAAATAALEQATQKVEDAERRRIEDLRRQDAEWKARLEAEKRAAVQAALRQVIGQQQPQQQQQEQEEEQQQQSVGQPLYNTAPNSTMPQVMSVQIPESVMTTPTQILGGGRTNRANQAPNFDAEASGNLSIGENGRKAVNTSSVSSDEHEESCGEVTFLFVSTEGLEKKRGRKSVKVTELEAEHEALVKRRKVLVDTNLELERMKQLDMTYAEKKAIVDEVAKLDYVRMKGVVDVIARGMGRPDILSEVEIDIDVGDVDNVVLREIQFFLKSPVAMTAKDALREIESNIADIETQLVDRRYQKVAEPLL